LSWTRRRREPINPGFAPGEETHDSRHRPPSVKGLGGRRYHALDARRHIPSDNKSQLRTPLLEIEGMRRPAALTLFIAGQNHGQGGRTPLEYDRPTGLIIVRGAQHSDFELRGSQDTVGASGQISCPFERKKTRGTSCKYLESDRQPSECLIVLCGVADCVNRAAGVSRIAPWRSFTLSEEPTTQEAIVSATLSRGSPVGSVGPTSEACRAK